MLHKMLNQYPFKNANGVFTKLVLSMNNAAMFYE